MAIDEMARTWDAWAAREKLRVVQSVDAYGAHAIVYESLSRIYDGRDVTVSINLARMPGQNSLIEISVSCPSELPRSTVENGCLNLGNISIPIPADAISTGHDDMQEMGGADEHYFQVSSFTLEEMKSMYEAWATSEGLKLYDRVEGLGDCSLFFRRSDGLKVSVSYYEPRAADKSPTLCIRN